MDGIGENGWADGGSTVGMCRVRSDFVDGGMDDGVCGRVWKGV